MTPTEKGGKNEGKILLQGLGSVFKKEEQILGHRTPDKRGTVELQWLEHLWDYENMFKTEVARANECYRIYPIYSDGLK